MYHRPASDLTSVHHKDSSWCRFLLHLDSAGLGIGSINEVFGGATVHQGSGGTFLAIGSLDPDADHYFFFSVASGCLHLVGWFFFFFCNWFLSRHRSRCSNWVWLFDFVVDAGTSLRMSRSWKECRHLAPDVLILERVLSPHSRCLDLGKGVDYEPQLHKRRL